MAMRPGTSEGARPRSRGKSPPKLGASQQQQGSEASVARALDSQAALVAATFANLELETAKATIEEYKTMCTEAKKENEKLVKELKERDQDALQVIEFVRHDLEEKKAKLRLAEQKLSTIEETLSTKQKDERAVWEQVVAEKDDTIRVLRGEVTKLHEELNSLALFKREKQEILLEMQRLKESQAATVQKYEKELTKLRFQALEEKVQLHAAEKEMTEKFNEEVDARAMLLVDVKARGIHDRNKNLGKEKQRLEEEIERLGKYCDQQAAALKEAHREVELCHMTIAEYAKQGCKLTRAAKDSADKARFVEGKMTAVTSRLEQKISSRDAEFTARIAELERELLESEKGKQIFRDELRRARGLAQQIVDQRSDLERFFYEALSYVRDRQGVEQRGGRGGRAQVPVASSHPASARAVPAPPLYPDEAAPPSAVPPLSARQGTARRPSIEFGTLSWEDKERVIRGLLWRINQSFYAPTGSTTRVEPVPSIEDAPAEGLEPRIPALPQSARSMRPESRPATRGFPVKPASAGVGEKRCGIVPPLSLRFPGKRPDTTTRGSRPHTSGSAGVPLPPPQPLPRDQPGKDPELE